MIPPRRFAAAAAVSSTAVRDLPLSRLLSTARLTPPQAVALGADLLTALENRDLTAGAGVHADAVRVGRDGRAHVIDTPAIGAGLTSAAAVLDGLRAAAGTSATDTGLLPALERAAAEARSPDGRLAFAMAILREADAPEGTRARAELAKLVAMVAGEVAPAPVADPAPRAAARRRPRSRRSPRAVARAVVAHSWKWVLSLAVLVTIVAVEITFLHDQISRDVHAVLDAGRSESTASEAPPPLPALPPAPPAAGTISRVDLRPVQRCTPDAGCALRTQVVVLPQPEPQTITWDLRIIDRCTGEAVTVPGGAVTVPPHADRADAISSVALPPGGVLSVMAVTIQPFTAASDPVDVAADAPGSGACTN
jgi:hypothetical protein